jgi:predicted TIM-barrel fold metal-dependent hydrolase
VGEVHRIRYGDAIDADGHVLEPPDLWERYLEPRYRERALRLRTDAEGLEYLEIGGRPSQLTSRGFPGTMAGMGKTQAAEFRPSPERTYLAAAAGSPGSMDAAERLARLDAEGLTAALLYPTLGLCWEAELADAELSQAYCRAYNRWIADFCRESGGRLVPIAHLSLGDPAAAARELERAVRDGCRGAFVVPFTASREPHGHPVHDPVFARAQDLGVPLALHPSFEPPETAARRFLEYRNMHLLRFAAGSDGVRHAFTTFFDFATFDRFPRLELVLLESGAGWIGYWLDRIDALYESTFFRQAVRLKEKPSDYFRRQCHISADPDETTVPALVELLGGDRFFWASDYPHPDHTGSYLQALERLADQLPSPAREGLLAENARRVYGLRV